MGFDMNYKIKVANEVESKEAQELFLNLGLDDVGDCSGMDWIASDHIAFSGYDSKTMNNFTFVKFKEITLPELRDLVVLKRGLIEDATHVDKEDHRFKYRLINNDWHVITAVNPVWRKDSIDLNDAPLFMKPIEKKEMKEYLEKQTDGSYVMKSGFAFKDAGWIEIPEGMNYAYKDELNIHFTTLEMGYRDSIVIWQRESPSDKLASAEQYRQAEALPFIDDEPKSAWDTQVGGDHYKKYKIQPMLFALENNLNPLQHSVLKYIMRHEDKNGKQDLEKAKHYIDLMIAHYYPAE